MLVYRLETMTGLGPYRQAKWHNDIYDSRLHFPKYRDSRNKNPVPSLDPLFRDKFISFEEFFGFESIESLTNWFCRRQLKQFDKHGFVIAVYKVPDKEVHKGTKQLVFKRGRKTPKLYSIHCFID